MDFAHSIANILRIAAQYSSQEAVERVIMWHQQILSDFILASIEKIVIFSIHFF